MKLFIGLAFFGFVFKTLAIDYPQCGKAYHYVAHTLDNFTELSEFISEEEDFSEGLALVSFDVGKYKNVEWFGFINTEGEWAIEPKLDEAWSFSEGVAAVAINSERWDCINEMKERNFELQAALFVCSRFDKADQKWGFINKKGEWAIEPRFDEALSFSEGLAAVAIDSEKWDCLSRSGVFSLKFKVYLNLCNASSGYNIWGFINKKGEWVIEPRFTEALFFSEGLALVEFDGKYGFINTKGEWVIEPRFDDETRGFYSGLANVKFEGKWGLIDKKGKWIVEPILDNRVYFKELAESEGLTEVQINKKWGLINAEGEWVIEPILDDVWDFSEGVARAAFKGLWGFINTKGEWVIEPRLDEARSFSEGLARVKSDGKWGFINTAGEWIIEPKLDEAWWFSEGVARVKSDGKWGFINTAGGWIIEPKLDEAGSFSEGVAKVKSDGKWGFINTAGGWIIEPKLDEAESFSEGLARVKSDGKYGFINTAGEWAIEPKFDGAWSFSEGLAKVKSDGKWGFINTAGEWAIEPKFDGVRSFSKGVAIARIKERKVGEEHFHLNSYTLRVVITRTKKGKEGLINRQGQWIIEPKFDSISIYTDETDGLFMAEKGESFSLIKIKAVKCAQKN